MKILILLILPITVFGQQNELVENLCYESDFYTWDWPFSDLHGVNNYWVAFDYDPNGAFTINEVILDWVYLDNISYRDDMNFEIYLTNFDNPPIITFTIPEGDYNEQDSGYTYVGVLTVYRGNIPLGGNSFGVSNGNKYWIALQMDTVEAVHAVGWGSVIGEYTWFWNAFGGWQTYNSDECSYALYGETSEIESSSLGEIKASFR